ncbi:36447_t:CDS:1, partial [Gigaspora margarita]
MCSICLHKFTSRIGYSQHRNSCIKTVDYDNDSQMPLNSYSKSHSFMKDFKNIQDNRPSNKNMVNKFSRTSENKSFSSKKISINSIKFGKQFHKSADNFSQIASKEENLCNILKDFKEIMMLFELEDKNDMSFKVAIDNNKEFFEILHDTLQNFKNIAKEIELSKS